MKEIFYNGKIITMNQTDAESTINEAPEAILVERGLIVKVGTLEEMRNIAGHRVKYHNLEGCCLMPAFIDSHSHFVMNAQMSLCADLSKCASFKDIVKSLKQYIADHHIKEKNAIVGFGYDHNFLKEGRHPDKRVLDQVSETIPIVILHVSAHLGCGNSAALKMAYINSETENPKGGYIGRLEDGKEPSGYLEESALTYIQKAVTPYIKKDFRYALKNMQTRYLKNGITTVQEGAATIQDFKLLKLLSRIHKIKLDIIVYPMMTPDIGNLMNKYGEAYRKYNKHLKIGGYKLVLDGSPQGKTAWMSSPYMNSGDYSGYAWLEDEIVEKNIEKALEEKRQIMAHCNGDAASEQFLNAYEKVLQRNKVKGDFRPVMIHCQTVRNDQLDKMKKLNMIASFFIGHVWYWGDVHIKNLGAERGNHISPVRDALDRKISVNFHQDTPVTEPDMLHSVWCAVNRISRSGKTIGNDQKISVYEALKAVTVNAAYQYYEEGQKGSIKEGKRADFVVLDKSPLEVDPMEVKDITILKTIKDGKVIYTYKKYV